jgi:aryl-alcohol dehydrogenase-like predicted oxidoreductase
MNFGNQTEEVEGHRIIHRALELGINFFDTANVYGAPACRPRRSSAGG